MTDEPPAWAIKLRAERRKRLWSQKVTAVHLRDAADEQTRATLPSVESLQRYVRAYEAGAHHPGDLYAALYCRIFGMSHTTLFGTTPERESTPGNEPFLTEHDAADLTAWITSTNISDDAIAHIANAVDRLAEAHTRQPPAQVLSGVIELHQQVQVLLREGRQRLRQTRELFRLDAELLAHACLLLGDLNRDRAATVHGESAALCAEEAGTNQAAALSAQAKTARWRGRLAESADLARRGFECSPRKPIRILLACQEANAAGLMGDVHRARQALARAEEAAAGPLAEDSGSSAWSCPVPRQALFALSVATRTADPDAALRAARMADDAWATGAPWVWGTWAQIRVGAGIAHVMKGSLDGAEEEVSPMLTLAPEYRMATVTRYLSELDRRLRDRRFRRSLAAANLTERIREFNARALTTQPAEEQA